MKDRGTNKFLQLTVEAGMIVIIILILAIIIKFLLRVFGAI